MKLKLVDGGEVALPSEEKAAARFLADSLMNHGRVPTNEGELDWNQMYRALSPKVKDAIATSEIRPLLEQSMQIIMREPVEPIMNISPLFTRVNARGMDTKVLAGALGAVYAQDVPELGTYPEVNFTVGGAMQTAYVGKSGIAAAFSDEALRYSNWDIMAINLRLMRNAMARHKEQKAVGFLRTLGTSLLDNASPAESLFGVCTGRAMDATANGTPTMDDLFKCVAHMTEEGFAPSALLVSPMTFYMGIQDPVMRNLFMMGAGGAYFQPWAGQAGPLDPWSNGAMGAQGPSLGNRLVPGGSPSGESASSIAGREHGMTSAPPMVQPYFPWALKVIVSPFIPYDAESQLADMYLVSEGNIGFHLVDEDLTEVSWRNESDESMKVKLRERYGYAVAHEGQGVGVMKNVKVGRNYWDGTVKAVSHDFDSEIEADTDLSDIL